VAAGQGGGNPSERARSSTLRRTVVAYAISEAMLRLSRRSTSRREGRGEDEGCGGGRSPSSALLDQCRVDNFVVRVSYEDEARSPSATSSRRAARTKVEGLDVLDPSLSLTLVEPYFLSDDFHRSFGGQGGVEEDKGEEDEEHEERGRFLEVEVRSSLGIEDDNLTGDVDAGSSADREAEGVLCRRLGELVYELYAGTPPAAAFDEEGLVARGRAKEEEPSREKKPSLVGISLDDDGGGGGASTARRSTRGSSRGVVPLNAMGHPASISLLARNLLDCGDLDGGDEFRPDDACPSLRVARDELHLLLEDPGRFLFDRVPAPGGGIGGTPALLGLDGGGSKLHGRDGEREAVAEVFCRVSRTGESEALFVHGFSGSGKSKLIQSVLGYVDVMGGYVVHKKFDPISAQRPVSVVLSAFDDLCSFVAQKNSPQELEAAVAELMAVFGAHLSLLAQVLPRVTLLSPALQAEGKATAAADDGGMENGAEINLGRVNFILTLFVRVVSSKFRPVMIFLDDIHNADGASLDVLQHVLSDIKGSSSIFFVGNYRSNEVPDDHAVLRLVRNLEEFDVRISHLHLDGMELGDVNHIVSDALGIVPRITRPLAQLVLQKTKGNPLFILECVRSLADRGLLRYGLRERRWMWDADGITTEEVAENVSSLLSTKMVDLAEDARMALKIASCFGNSVGWVIVEILMSNPRFPNLRRELDNAVKEGFVIRDDKGEAFRFSHDKVQEAAYSLIPEEDKSQLHHQIGIHLYENAIPEQFDSLIFVIVNQINRGDIPDDMRVRIADLNHRAASKAMASTNIVAAYACASAAARLLPNDHWESQYDLSRNVFLLLGNAAYTDGRFDEASSALDQILEQGKLLKDKFDAYFLKISLVS
ncbi:hypothetical protein ACHAWF_016673, partial [Thalassiosira exigua]